MPAPRFLLLLAVAFSPAFADEGMWPYNRLPLDQLERYYGFEPDEAFLERLQRASVRLNNGGSGSFVSPDGLVMTNHHVAADCIRKLSSEDNDYVADGYHASSRDEELACPDLEINVLMEIETVTERMNADVTDEMSDAERLETQRATQAAIESECNEATGMRCDVVNLYQGGIFDLYKYERYTDVRLVFAPEFAAAYFGGDPDNFTFPRYCLDVSFLRVYRDDEPIESPSYLPLDPDGAEATDLTLVSGHPGTTRRLMTSDQLRFERDRRMPMLLQWLRAMADELIAYGRSGGEAARLARDELFSLNNSIKAYTGMVSGLRDRDLFQSKISQERELQERIAEDPELEGEFGDSWDKIAEAQRVKQRIYDEYRLLGGLGFYSKYFNIARHLYRLSEELERPDGERLEEYHEAGLESLYQQLYSPAPIYPEVEIVKLSQSLSFLRNRLGPSHPVVKTVLDGRLPEQAARELVEGTNLGDVEFRKELGADDAAQAADSDDPMIALARAIDEESRAVRKRYEDEVEAVEKAAGARIARARFAALGDGVYPDATFTLRLSFGTVKPYFEESGPVEAFTVMEGLFEKETGEDPYVLPDRFLKAKSRLDLSTPYNLVTTNDITGGNSGSPLISREGEIVGLIFDGNIQSLPYSFLYSERQARAVSVDVRGILEALRGVYRARRLVNELTPER